MAKHDPFKYFKTSPEVIRLAGMMCVRFPLSLRNVEDLLHDRGIEVSREPIRFWWNRFGQTFASEIRSSRIQRIRAWSTWQCHFDKTSMKINGETHYMWRRVDLEGEVLDAFVTKRCDRKAALKVLRKLMKRYGRPEWTVTDLFRSYAAALKEIGNADRQVTACWMNNRTGN